MTHLLISREYPPCSYPMGGIGTYVRHIAHLLAERGETVHVIAERWSGAPLARETALDGRLIVHRVAMNRPIDDHESGTNPDRHGAILAAMATSPFPAQAFAWQAAIVAERLVESEQVDIIEAQEYEAPLYYFLLRRALGLGPARTPPCVVHLHTTREQVAAANDWGLRPGHDLVVKRMEDFTIRQADALLCPSGFLADKTERQLDRTPGSIERVPYPIGEVPYIERPADVWTNGAVLYVGRFEARKGVFEWMAAAIDVAREHPGVRFELIGSDTRLHAEHGPSVRSLLESQVPRELAHAFTFRDGIPRDQLWAHLARARVAVVPSRWENFPHTCVEAMCTGSPVLVSPNGGMAEMIEHRVTGWIAASGSARDLAAALREALATPPATLSDMGRAASASIRRQCDNDQTIARQIAFRRTVIAAASTRSRRVHPGIGHVVQSHAVDARRRGVAVVVIEAAGQDLERCLTALRLQTAAPAAVVIVQRPESASRTYPNDQSWVCISSPVQPRAAGVHAALTRAPLAAGVVTIDGSVVLSPTFVARSSELLARDPDIGIVTTWYETAGGHVRLDAAVEAPYTWITSLAAPATTIRTEALLHLEWTADVLGDLPAFDSLALPVIAGGWLGATIPDVLYVAASKVSPSPTATTRLRDATLERCPESVAAAAPLMAKLILAATPVRETGVTAFARAIVRAIASSGRARRLPQ